MRRRSDRGSASVLVLVMAAVLLLVALALVTVGAVVHRHRIAQSAADLGALAGAAAVQRGQDGCGAVAGVVTANGGRVESCVVTVEVVEVVVTVPAPRLLGLGADPRARARAGPHSAGARGGTAGGWRPGR